jgi:hypothetical protein
MQTAYIHRDGLGRGALGPHVRWMNSSELTIRPAQRMSICNKANSLGASGPGGLTNSGSLGSEIQPHVPHRNTGGSSSPIGYDQEYFLPSDGRSSFSHRSGSREAKLVDLGGGLLEGLAHRFGEGDQGEDDADY